MTLIESKPPLGTIVRASDDSNISLNLTFATSDPSKLEVQALTEMLSPGKKKMIPLMITELHKNSATFSASIPCTHAGLFSIALRYRNGSTWSWVHARGKRSDIEVKVEPSWLGQSAVADIAGGSTIHDSKFLLPHLKNNKIKAVTVSSARPDRNFMEFRAAAHNLGVRVLVKNPKPSAYASWINAGADGFEANSSSAEQKHAQTAAAKSFPQNGMLDGSVAFVESPKSVPNTPKAVYEAVQQHSSYTPNSPKSLVLATTLPGNAVLGQLSALDPLAAKLSKLKAEHPALRGAAKWLDNNQPIENAQLASFARIHPEETLVVCVNMSEHRLHPTLVNLDGLPINTNKPYLLHDLLTRDCYERKGDLLVLLDAGQSHIFEVIQRS